MYALAINGSPREGGNTEVLLNQVLAPIKAAGWETELLQVGGKKITGCRACYKCGENKNLRCVIANDILNDVLEKMLRADAIILGSPTYFADVSSEMKALIDRAGFVAGRNDRAFRGKIGASVVAVRRGGATHAFDTMNHLFQISGMIMPGSTYWNMGYGLQKQDVLEDAEGLNNMRNLGEVIAWLGKAIHPHLASLPQ